MFRRLEEQGKLVKLPTNNSELNLATGMLPDEWNDRGREFAEKAWDLKTEVGEGQEERAKSL